MRLEYEYKIEDYLEPLEELGTEDEDETEFRR